MAKAPKRSAAEVKMRDNLAAQFMCIFIGDVSRQIATGTLAPGEHDRALLTASRLSYRAADFLVAERGRER